MPRKQVGHGEGLVPALERIVESTAQTIVSRVKAFDKVIGDRPYGKEKLPERDQVKRYALVRDNPEAWSDIIKQHGVASALEYSNRLEKLSQHYPEEAGMLAAPAMPLEVLLGNQAPSFDEREVESAPY